MQIKLHNAGLASSPLKKAPGEGTGPTIHADMRGNPVGRVPSRGDQDLLEQAANRRTSPGITTSSIWNYFASCSPVLLTAIGTLTVLFIGLIDFVTGPEIALSIFYLIPIAFTTWFAGRAPGLFTAVFSASIWLAADLASAPVYSHAAIPVWNSAVRLGIFNLMAHLLSSIRGLTGNLEQAVQKKTVLLNAEIKARKELQKEVTELTTKQRQAIAYELHDGLCPLLGGIAMKAKILEDSLADQDSPDAASAGELVSLLKNANQQARLLARGLDPIAVELHGLTSALAKLAAETEKLSRVKCVFKTDLDRVPVSPSRALQLYRIAQEAIHNACVHGGAGCIQVELSNDASHPDRGRSPSAAAPSVAGVEKFERDRAAVAAANGNGSRAKPGRLRLKITDDGTGFPEDRMPAEGLGLRIMRFRAECIGAVFWIESSPTQGTTVQCCLAALEQQSDDVRRDRDWSAANVTSHRTEVRV